MVWTDTWERLCLLASSLSWVPMVGLEERAQVSNLVDRLPEIEAVKVYWQQRDRLYLRGEIVYRKTPDGVEQLLVLKALREKFLELAHNGITGGHLGVHRPRWQARR